MRPYNPPTTSPLPREAYEVLERATDIIDNTLQKGALTENEERLPEYLYTPQYENVSVSFVNQEVTPRYEGQLKEFSYEEEHQKIQDVITEAKRAIRFED